MSECWLMLPERGRVGALSWVGLGWVGLGGSAQLSCVRAPCWEGPHSPAHATAPVKLRGFHLLKWRRILSLLLCRENIETPSQWCTSHQIWYSGPSSIKALIEMIMVKLKTNCLPNHHHQPQHQPVLLSSLLPRAVPPKLLVFKNKSPLLSLLWEGQLRLTASQG